MKPAWKAAPSVAVVSILAVSLCSIAVPVSAQTQAQKPSLGAISASVQLSQPRRDGFAGKATIRVRFCAEIGPRAVLLIRETRKRAGATMASARSVEPLGVDLTGVVPYQCVRGFVVAWLIPARLVVGGGTYSVTVRLQDGRGRLTPSVGFSLRT